MHKVHFIEAVWREQRRKNGGQQEQQYDCGGYDSKPVLMAELEHCGLEVFDFAYLAFQRDVYIGLFLHAHTSLLMRGSSAAYRQSAMRLPRMTSSVEKRMVP